ncbi:meiotic nuclear division protein 1 homolog isoform X1 [Sycon ciliatum]|uniref:meiotic nuclear division protein 1 homolog isoform X1 n=1 Tax=Sycon ciliatum TaxID=27933 RepID=UPI0031F6EF71
MPKHGLSVEEKRKRLLQLLFEKKDFFQLKELEKMAPKEKGITTQSVKDVLQSLVDDAMVDTDRIGTSNYFWALPSKAATAKRNKLARAKESLQTYRKKRTTLDDTIAKMSTGRENSEKRKELLSELAGQQEKHATLRKELQAYHDCDPAVLQEKADMSDMLKDASNRWTDNVFSVKSWCKNKFSIQESMLNKQFDIPEDLDYLS